MAYRGCREFNYVVFGWRVCGTEPLSFVFVVVWLEGAEWLSQVNIQAPFGIAPAPDSPVK
jgi:hypothetical protein